MLKTAFIVTRDDFRNLQILRRVNVWGDKVGKRATRRPEMAKSRPQWKRLGRLKFPAIFLPISLGMLLLHGGCTVVRPYQREHLAERCMSPGFGDKSEVKFRAHWEYARHGTQGGFGDDAGGGGCGCN